MYSSFCKNRPSHLSPKSKHLHYNACLFYLTKQIFISTLTGEERMERKDIKKEKEKMEGCIPRVIRHRVLSPGTPWFEFVSKVQEYEPSSENPTFII